MVVFFLFDCSFYDGICQRSQATRQAPSAINHHFIESGPIPVLNGTVKSEDENNHEKGERALSARNRIGRNL